MKCTVTAPSTIQYDLHIWTEFALRESTRPCSELQRWRISTFHDHFAYVNSRGIVFSTGSGCWQALVCPCLPIYTQICKFTLNIKFWWKVYSPLFCCLAFLTSFPKTSIFPAVDSSNLLLDVTPLKNVTNLAWPLLPLVLITTCMTIKLNLFYFLVWFPL